MTLQEVLKEIDIVSKVVKESTRVSLNYLEVGSDEELLHYTTDNRIRIHKPCGEFPQYWFAMKKGNLDIIVSGKSKKVSII